MNTFTPARPFTRHPGYCSDREHAHRELEEEMRKGSIDPPLLPLIRECIPIRHCYTVQCCFGHFVHDFEPETENIVPLSLYTGKIEKVRYRIAYFALCLEDTSCGRRMYHDLEALAASNPDYIQFGCADWFWERMVNTYIIQLEPERLRAEDNGMIPMEEALHIEELREEFYGRLAGIIHTHRIS